MQQRQAAGRRNGVGQAVHGVRTQHEVLRPGGGEAPGRSAQLLPKRIPGIGVLQRFDLSEVRAPEQQFRGGTTPKARLHLLIDAGVVGLGRFPAHAPQEAKNFHGRVRSTAVGKAATLSLPSLATAATAKR